MSTELEELLRDSAAQPRRGFDVEAAYRRGRRRQRALAVSSGVASMLVLVVAIVVTQQWVRPQVLLGPGEGAAGWELLPDAPLTPRSTHAAVWTGEEMVVWGGLTREFGYPQDGAAYDPASRRWRSLPDAPIPGRANPVAVWTGQEMLVVGGWQSSARRDADGGVVHEDPLDGSSSTEPFRADGAAYDPAADAWRGLPEMPLTPRDHMAAAWTGSELIVWGGMRINVMDRGFLGDGAAYNPTTDTWRVLAASPLSARAGHVAQWTGDRLLVWGGVDNLDEFVGLTDGAAYDPATDTWESIPDSPAYRGNPSMDFAASVWTGEELVVWFGSDAAVYHDALQTWRRLPAAPTEGVRLPGDAVWSGTEALFWGGWVEHSPEATGGFTDSGTAYRPTDGTWRTLEDAPVAARASHSVIWTGDAMLVWGGTGEQSRLPWQSTVIDLGDGAAYRPPTAPRRDPTRAEVEAFVEELAAAGATQTIEQVCAEFARNESFCVSFVPGELVEAIRPVGSPQVECAAWDEDEEGWWVVLSGLDTRGERFRSRQMVLREDEQVVAQMPLYWFGVTTNPSSGGQPQPLIDTPPPTGGGCHP